MMSKMEKLVVLMAFWFSPWGAAKGETWEWFTHDEPMEEQKLFNIIAFIINGIDEKFVTWEALDGFKKSQMEAIDNGGSNSNS